MGWHHNNDMSWEEINKTLSEQRRFPGKQHPADPRTRVDPRRPGPVLPDGADGGEAPAWSQKRQPYVPLPVERPTDAVPYAELHVHSNYSFLDGASEPEELVEEAVRLGLSGMALTDHDGFYGVVRLAEAAERFTPFDTVFGAELSLGLSGPQNGSADPEGSHLLLLARQQEGYHRLSGAITKGQLARGAEKGRPVYDLDQLAAAASGGHLTALTGCRKGAVRQALVDGGPRQAEREVDRLVDLFGADNVVVELIDTGDPLASDHNDALWAIAERRGLAAVATGNVHYARPQQHRLASALAAVRARRSLDDLDGWLPATSSHLRSGAEMQARFARYPGVVAHSVELARQLSFPLRSMKPKLPMQEVPEGHTQMSWLRQLVWDAVPRKYPDAPQSHLDRIERELKVIEDKDFPGYFLIVHDIVAFARGRGILCQGRGSAANSAICYLLDITAIDAIFFNLPFERFLSSMREEEPDIDVDFDADRREEAIQYVFEKYGRENAAQVANVITYRPKFAVRDMAKALGYSPGQQDAWSKNIESWNHVTSDGEIPEPVVELANEVMRFPRHLGIHSGGMVLTARPVGEIVPIEHARMEKRTVLQWEKDDCASMGLVKFDLLGLGMLAAIQHCFDIVKTATGEEWTLATMPKEEAAVYDMLCRADAVGVFQVESRAQLNTLPRLQPRRFYELAIEIALIRPGPIQGGSVHPYIRRKTGKEKVSYLHPSLEPLLERTMGVPLFQEQLMQIAVTVGNCTGEEADTLRRAMGSKRGLERIESIREKLYAGMKENGLDQVTSDKIYSQIQAFAGFGFAESHSLSFALLVYASSWIKLHYPAAFLAGLLRSQPMGFYSAATLTADARRHGVTVLRPDIGLSGVMPDLEGPAGATGLAACCGLQPPVADFDPTAPDVGASHRRDANHAVRLGLADVTGIGTEVAQRIVSARAAGPYTSMADLVRRADLTTAQLEALATAGAFESLGLSRRQAIWDAGNAARDRAEFLPGSTVTVTPPLFPMLNPQEQLVADLWATGVSPDDHPMRHVRAQLEARGVLSASQLRQAEAGRRIEVAGVVIHRQRPSSAAGVTFLNLEDETGMINVICAVGTWKHYRRVALGAPAMIIRGILERTDEGVTNVLVDRFEALPVRGRVAVRNFH